MAVFFLKHGAVPSLGKALSDYAEGDLVQIPENGTPVEFYVAKHDYESQLNGAGRTLLVRKEAWQQSAWNSSGVNVYANGTLDNFLNSEYASFFNQEVLALIATTKFYYTVGGGNNSVAQLQKAIFCLSLTELGYSGIDFNAEGVTLPISSILSSIYFGYESVTAWTRTPSKGGTWAVYRQQNISMTGSNYSVAASGAAQYSRPCFTLPASTKFDPSANIIM